jgi:hypothetical protein
MPHVHNLSDHKIVCVAMKATVNDITAYVPDRQFANDLYERLIELREEPTVIEYLNVIE